MELMIGADPEVFFVNDNGEFVSAKGIVKGSKRKPFKTSFGAVQLDGLAAEFNINPAKSVEDFVSNIREARTYLWELAITRSLSISYNPVAKFDPEYFFRLDDGAFVLGCEPDFSAITGKVKDSPDICFEPIRTSSGHIHIGWTEGKKPFEKLHFNKCKGLANFMGPLLDNFVSGWVSPSLSKERRKYYGDEFAFRPKPYGVELRQLGPEWIINDQRTYMMYEFVKHKVEEYFNMYDSISYIEPRAA